MTEHSLLSCRDITIQYENQIAVKNVSFEVSPQDYLCIVGENGSGKSSLMKCILGLLKPVSGQIVYNGIKSIEIGYLSQQTVVQKDFPASVFEVVLSGCLNRHGILPFYTSADKYMVYETLQMLRIEPLNKRCYRDLSGGQQQRVLLARALCATKTLLLLDEPVTGLDPEGTAEMYALLQKLNREAGITIIMVTHDIRSAVAYGNKILHMKTSPLYFGSVSGYMQTEAGKRMLGGETDA